jgi:hypothetical protein
MYAPQTIPVYKEAALNLSDNLQTRKEISLRLKPTCREGLNIQYRLKDAGESFSCIKNRMGTSLQIIADVVFGRRRSARVEAEIARLLGKSGWNEVVLEARSAVTGKSVETIKDELARRRAEREKAVLEGYDINDMAKKVAARKRGA